VAPRRCEPLKVLTTSRSPAHHRVEVEDGRGGVVRPAPRRRKEDLRADIAERSPRCSRETAEAPAKQTTSAASRGARARKSPGDNRGEIDPRSWLTPAHPGSSRLISAHLGSSRLISAHLGSSRAVDELDPVGDAVDGGVVPREPQPRGVDVDRDDVAARARKLDGVACPQTERPLRLGATSHLRRSALVDGLAQRLEAPSLGRCSRAALL